MKTVSYTKNYSIVEFSADELLVFNAALNEICNGMNVPEFDTRIGASREEVIALLKSVQNALDRMDSFQD
jgi:hypothetical protein